MYKETLILRKTPKPLHRIDSNFIPGYLTKQSVFAAICIAIISYIFQSSDDTKIKIIYFQFFFIDFYFSTFIIFIVFISLIFSLISILYYDYSLRFRWNKGITISLLVQGLRTDSWSFYLLVIALLLVVSASYPALSIVLNSIFIYFLGQYYFFGQPKSFLFKSKQNIFLIGDRFQGRKLKNICLDIKDMTKLQSAKSLLAIKTSPGVCLRLESNIELSPNQFQIQIEVDTDTVFVFIKKDDNNEEKFSILLPFKVKKEKAEAILYLNNRKILDLGLLKSEEEKDKCFEVYINSNMNLP